MPMKKRLLLFTIACILSPLLDGCHSSHKTVAHKTSKQPEFINDIYIAPHNKSSATANAITPKRAPEKAKATTLAAKKDSYPPPSVTASAGSTRIYPASYKLQKEKDEDEPELPRSVKKKYAEILGVKTKEISNASLYLFIDKWLGANYRRGGCDISGIDCSGFVQKLYAEVYGTDLLRTAIDQFSSCKRIKHSRDAEEGDLVFFHIKSRKRITHVGIYLANDYFVHASTSNGVIISNLNEEYWHRYFAGCGRVPKGGS
jgi:cell wall-associated NlpC family hydrolase